MTQFFSVLINITKSGNVQAFQKIKTDLILFLSYFADKFYFHK